MDKVSNILRLQVLYYMFIAMYCVFLLLHCDLIKSDLSIYWSIYLSIY